MKIIKTLPPMHPGEMLREEFLKPLRLTPYAVAKACGIPRTRIERIAREELGTPHCGSPGCSARRPNSGSILQTRYDKLTAQRAIAKEQKRITPLSREAA